MKIKNRLFRNPVFWAFIISFAYWGYLILTSRMEISCDAFGYESLGKIIMQQGWLEFFKTGPQREPLYPAIISFSMWMEKISGVSYQVIQAIFQLSMLFLTQILSLSTLRVMKINNSVSAITIMYLGFSPAIMNSALSLFSEIIVYPLTLFAILLMYLSWPSFSGPKLKIAILGILTGLVLILLTLSKGVFEFICPVFVVIYFMSTFFSRNRKLILSALIYAIIVLIIFYASILGYKSANKVFNGRFVITDRGAHMLYGSCARRTETMTAEIFLASLAYIPGEGVCNAIFDKETCFFWSPAKLDEFAYTKTAQLQIGNRLPEEIDKELFRSALKKLQERPAQFLLLWFEEGLKIFFWESTQIGFVSYPVALTRLFCWSPVKNGLRFLMAILTFAAFLYVVYYLLKERNKIFIPGENAEIILFLAVIFVLLFTAIQAIFIILGRYALPVAPLFSVISAFFIQKVIFTRNP